MLFDFIGQRIRVLQKSIIGNLDFVLKYEILKLAAKAQPYLFIHALLIGIICFL